MTSYENEAKNALVGEILSQVEIGTIIHDAIKNQAADFVMMHLDSIYDAIAEEISETVEMLFEDALSDAISEVAESII